MRDLVGPLFVVRTRAPVSSSPLLVDANDDGWPELFVGGARFYGLTWDGTPLPRWPKRARRPFASSAAFGDINGDGRGELVIGCDDGRVYAYFADGTPVEGWPFVTHRDVFSTPALADLDGDGALEVIVGSDDGSLRVLKGDGMEAWRSQVPGSPFISASPTVADLDGDGTPEIAVGAWDRRIHVWTGEGRPYSPAMPGGGGIVWSSATAFRLEGRGMCLAWSSDGVRLASGRGALAAGWPQPTDSWMVSSPALVKFAPGHTALVAGSERLYAWDLLGRPLPGWPVNLERYVWSSPIAFDVDGDGTREVVVGGWDGGLHAVRLDGSRVPGFPLQTGGPIFSSPAAAPLPDGGGLLVVASWDGTVRGWRLPEAVFGEGDWPQFRGSAARTGVLSVPVGNADGNPRPTPDPVGRPQVTGARSESWFGGARRTVLHGSDLEMSKSIMVHYRIPGEATDHISPVVKSGERFVALIQPLRLPRRVHYWVEMERRDDTKQRWPPKGYASTLQFPSAIERFLQGLSTRLRRAGDQAVGP